MGFTPSDLEALKWVATLILVLFVVFMVLREVNCWYFKINEGLKLLREIRQEIAALRTGLPAEELSKLGRPPTIQEVAAQAAAQRAAMPWAGGIPLSAEQFEVPCAAVVTSVMVVPTNVPSEKGMPMATLRQGHVVTVYEVREGWGRISREGVEPRWVRLDVLQRTERGP